LRDPQRLHARPTEPINHKRGLIPCSAVKVQSEPHGDMGSQTEMIWPASREFVEVIDVIEWRVTQLPKVGTPPYVLEAAAPRIGDDAVRSRLYAGKTENPPLLVVQYRSVTAFL